MDALGRSVTGDTLAGQRLDGKDHTGNLGTTPVDTLEAVNIGRIRKLCLLLFVGVLDELDLVVDLTVGLVPLAREAPEGSLRLIVLAVSHEPPGT